jgi:hypothetical protein
MRRLGCRDVCGKDPERLTAIIERCDPRCVIVQMPRSVSEGRGRGQGPGSRSESNQRRIRDDDAARHAQDTYMEYVTHVYDLQARRGGDSIIQYPHRRCSNHDHLPLRPGTRCIRPPCGSSTWTITSCEEVAKEVRARAALAAEAGTGWGATVRRGYRHHLWKVEPTRMRRLCWWARDATRRSTVLDAKEASSVHQATRELEEHSVCQPCYPAEGSGPRLTPDGVSFDIPPA